MDTRRNLVGDQQATSHVQDASASPASGPADASEYPPSPLASHSHPAHFARLRGLLHRLWEGDPADLDKDTSNELAVVRTNLAISRTLMAADRTLMAWIRTALSMNSFGFTIYKLLDGYARSAPSMLPGSHTARNVGLFLTGMGTFAMVMGVVEYWQSIRDLRALKAVPLFRPTLVMGLLMAALGLILFFGIITKLF